MTTTEPDLFRRQVTENHNGYLRCAAVFSKDVIGPGGSPRYRYVLERVWDEDKPLALWIMFNSSTASHLNDDPTIKRVVGFSKFYGMGSARVINLYAFRTPDPLVLWQAHRDGVDVIGPQNDELIVGDLAGMNGRPGIVIVGWGAGKAGMEGLLEQREAFIREHYFGAWCLGVTKGGHPKHPLYLASATALDAW